MPDRVRINVFITKSQKIRARITEPGYPLDKSKQFEVTVNGKSWREGKGIAYRVQILEKAHKLFRRIGDEIVTGYLQAE